MKKIGITGVVAVAALALTALLGTGAAYATAPPQIVFDSYPASVKGTLSEDVQLYTSGTGAVCSSGGTLNGGASGSLTALSTSVGDLGCTTAGVFHNMEMHGCGFTFHPGAEIGEGVYTGTYDIGPAGCGPITYVAYTPFCEVKIYPKTGLAAEFENVTVEGKRGIRATSLTEALKYSGGCGATMQEKGILFGSWTLSARSAGGAPINMHIEEEEITGTAFTAAEYPTSVGATLSAASKKFFSFEKGISAECGKASVSGTLLKEVGQLSLSPSYAECVAFGYQGASMLMNGCQYLMHPGTETGEGTFAGTFDIDCPTGSSIVIKAATCEVSIPSQANAGTIEYANREAGEVEEKEVAAAIVLSGGSEHLKYTKAKDGFLCPLNGTGTKEDGALAINGALEGSSLIQITG